MKIGARVVLFNVRMKERRKELGMTQQQLADLSGVNPSTISKIEILQPLKPTNTTRKHLHDVAYALDVEFDYLFPVEYIKAMTDGWLPGIRNLVFVKDISLDKLPPTVEDFRLPSPEDIAEDNMMKADVKWGLKELPECERMVIEYRYGIGYNRSHTLEETGRKINVTRERVRQIEQTGLSMLRNPKVISLLRDYR